MKKKWGVGLTQRWEYHDVRQINKQSNKPKKRVEERGDEGEMGGQPHTEVKLFDVIMNQPRAKVRFIGIAKRPDCRTHLNFR